MLNQSDVHYDENDRSSLSLAVKLEVLGSTVTLVGEALSTFAVFAALEEAREEEIELEREQQRQEEQFQMMQEQMDAMKKELADIKRR